MARNVITDLLQDASFWLMDVAPVEALAIPIFTPLFGFSTISAPQITLETTDITEANSLFRRKVVRRGDVDTITLQRGARFYDSDFYRWTMAALRGNTEGFDVSSSVSVGRIGGATPRRDLLLVQYFRRFPIPGVPSGATQEAVGAAVNQALFSSTISTLNVGQVAVAATVALGVAVSPLGPFEIYPRLPARAWLLQGCLPVRYKAGSDFDAASGQVSIQELDIAVESMEEISLAAN